MHMSTHKSSKNQQPPYTKEANKWVIRSLPSQVFHLNILKARHLVASKQITTSVHSFFSLQSVRETPASFSHNPLSCQKEQLQFINFKKKGTFHTQIKESQYNYQDEIPTSREKIKLIIRLQFFPSQ